MSVVSCCDCEAPSSSEVVLNLLQRSLPGLRYKYGRKQDVDNRHHTEEQEGRIETVAIHHIYEAMCEGVGCDPADTNAKPRGHAPRPQRKDL